MYKDTTQSELIGLVHGGQISPSEFDWRVPEVESRFGKELFGEDFEMDTIEKKLYESDLVKDLPTNPLHRAMGFTKLLKELQEKISENGNGGSSGEELEKAADEAIEEMKAAKKKAEKEGKGKGKENGGKKGGDDEGGHDPDKIAAEYKIPKNKLNFLNLIDQLMELPMFKSGTSKKKIDDPTGKFQKTRRIKDYSEIKRVRPVEYVMPNFGLDFARRSLSVVQRQKKIDKQKRIIVGIDDSGSMSIDEKVAHVKGILFLLQQKLKSGELEEILLFKFVRHPSHHKIFRDHVKMMEYLVHYTVGGGGDTFVGSAVQTIMSKLPVFGKETLKKGNFHNEMILINDGQDPVDSPFVVKTHGISLEEENPALRRNCRESGGTFQHIPLSTFDWDDD